MRPSPKTGKSGLIVFGKILELSLTFLNGDPVKTATSQRLLGVILTDRYSNWAELKARAAIVSEKLTRFTPLWRSAWIGRNRKIVVVVAVVQAAYIYAVHTMVLTASQQRYIDSQQQRWLRRVLDKPTVRDGVPTRTRNIDVLHFAKQQKLSRQILGAALRWFGHVYRLPNDSIIRKAHFCGQAPVRSTLLRNPGRPRKEWSATMYEHAVIIANSRQVSVDTLMSNTKRWNQAVRENLKLDIPEQKLLPAMNTPGWFASLFFYRLNHDGRSGGVNG